jgi:hypothetical protein
MTTNEMVVDVSQDWVLACDVQQGFAGALYEWTCDSCGQGKRTFPRPPGEELSFVGAG